MEDHNNLLVVLGANDPEMEAIEKLCLECGCPVAYATAEGVRVHPGNMYKADGAIYADGQLYSPGQPVYVGSPCYVVHVECGFSVLPQTAALRQAVGGPPTAIRIDHHAEGDPGFGRPPSEFLAASSLGQMISLLATHGLLTWVGGNTCPDEHRPWEIGQLKLVRGRWSICYRTQGHDTRFFTYVPRDLVLTAAADHCLGAAYRGQCPGVDPDELMRWRAESRAAFQRRSVADVLADIEAAKAVVCAAPWLDIGARHLYGCDYHGHQYAEAGCPECTGPGLVRDLRTIRSTEAYAFLSLQRAYDAAASAGATEDELEKIVDLMDAPWGETPSCEHDAIRRILAGASSDARGAAVPELPEAALRLGEAYLAGPLRTREGRLKIVLGGANTPEQVRAFLDTWAPANGVIDTYGDPARGFAGGFLEERKGPSFKRPKPPA